MTNTIKHKHHKLWRDIKRVVRARLFIAGSILIIFLAFILTFTSNNPNLKSTPEATKQQPLKLSQEPPQPKLGTVNTVLAPTPLHNNEPTAPHQNLPPPSLTTERSHNQLNSSHTTALKHTDKLLPSNLPTPANNDIALTLLTPSDTKQIAIIIDDIGYSRELGDAFIHLPYPLTLAFIPFSPYGKTLSQKAFKLNKPVMLHAPMATLGDKKWEESLSPDMSSLAINTLLNRMLADIPNAIGVNNHGGSLFTQTDHSMNILLSSLAEKGLFFIDSRTSAESVAKVNAYRHKVKFNQRDVFLDNVREKSAIESQLNKLITIAQKHDYAIGIAHPYPETLAVLTEQLAQLDKQNISLVSVSALLAKAKTK